MNSRFVQLLVRWLFLAIGVTTATKLVHGIRCEDAATLVVVVVLLSFFNAILRPVLVLFTLPFILVTLGLGVLVINAFLFLLVGRLVEGFHVDGFMAAFWGSAVVSLTNLILSAFFRPKGPPGRKPVNMSFRFSRRGGVPPGGTPPGDFPGRSAGGGGHLPGGNGPSGSGSSGGGPARGGPGGGDVIDI